MKPTTILGVALTLISIAVSTSLWADGRKSSKYTRSYDSEHQAPAPAPTPPTSGYTSGAATLNHPGRLLASNCFQCHGTNGHGMESLAGKSASSISSELYEMRLKPASNDIMNAHAQGYSTSQINLIADYFSKQQK